MFIRLTVHLRSNVLPVYYICRQWHSLCNIFQTRVTAKSIDFIATL